MASCLGLYIEEKLIKYAKVSKEHDKTNIDSFGVRFYENLQETISQIINETDSRKIPISINLTEEMYNYFSMPTLFNSKDLSKAIKTEFEMFCSEKGYNPNVFTTKYAAVDNVEQKDSLRIIHIAENKIELSKKTQQLSEYRLSNIMPLSMTISNLINIKPKENYIIFNIEEETTITTIIDEKIYNIKKIEKGSGEFLGKIASRENSYSKAYEICKNTTIYTSESDIIGTESNETLGTILPTIMDLAEELRLAIKESGQNINKIYITGTGTIINNVDLYIQEYIPDTECEVLKPYFANVDRGISIKDYIEVNSALSLAMSGLGEGIQTINFKDNHLNGGFPNLFKSDGSKKRTSRSSGNMDLRNLFKNDLGEKLDAVEMHLIRSATGLLLLFVIYSVLSYGLNNQIQQKMDDANESIKNTNEQISLAESDNNKIKSKTNEYTTMIKNLQELNDKITDANRSKKAIPNLLNSIMYVIPENVQITSIQNTTNRHVVIEAQSDKYEQLGMFKAKIQNDVLLTNVISTAGQKDKEIVTVKIEGELP